MTNSAIWRQQVDAVAVRQTLMALDIVVRPDPSFWSVRSAPGHGLPRFRFSRPHRRIHEEIIIIDRETGEEIVVAPTGYRGNQVKIGIEASKIRYTILRREVQERDRAAAIT